MKLIIFTTSRSLEAFFRDRCVFCSTCTDVQLVLINFFLRPWNKTRNKLRTCAELIFRRYSKKCYWLVSFFSYMHLTRTGSFWCDWFQFLMLRYTEYYFPGPFLVASQSWGQFREGKPCKLTWTPELSESWPRNAYNGTHAKWTKLHLWPLLKMETVMELNHFLLCLCRTQNLWTRPSRVPSRPSSHLLRPRHPSSSASSSVPLRNVTTAMPCSAYWISLSLPNTCWKVYSRLHV